MATFAQQQADAYRAANDATSSAKGLTTATYGVVVPRVSAPTVPAATGPQSSTVSTSANARGQVDGATTYLDSYNQQQAARDAARQTQPPASADTGSAGSASQGDSSGQDILSTIDTLTGSDSGTGVKSALYSSLAQQRSQDEQYARDRARVVMQLTQLQSNSDAATANLIEDIKTNYDGMVAQQVDANRRYERGVGVAGIVSGRSQYAPDVQGGIVHAAVSAGIQKIMDIQAKREQLISQAEVARNDAQYKILTATADAIRQTYTDERDAARQTRDDLMQADQYGRDVVDYNAKNAASSVASLLTGDPAADQETLQTAADQIGVPLQNLAAAVDEYRRQAIKDAPGAAGEFLYLQANGMLPQGVSSYGGYVSWKAAASRAPAGPGKTIPQTVANKAGLTGLAGVPYSTFYGVAVGPGGKWQEGPDGSPPAWFQSMVDQEYQASIFDAKPLWDEFKASPGAKQLLTGDTSQSSLESALASLSSADLSGGQ